MVKWVVGDSVDYEVNGTWYPGYIARSDSSTLYFKYEASKFKSYEEPIKKADRDDLARLRAGTRAAGGKRLETWRWAHQCPGEAPAPLLAGDPRQAPRGAATTDTCVLNRPPWPKKSQLFISKETCPKRYRLARRRECKHRLCGHDGCSPQRRCRWGWRR